jgi:sortase A
MKFAFWPRFLSVFRFFYWTNLRRALPLIAIAIGAGLLMYVGSQYWTMYSGQQKLTREWERQQQKSAATEPTPAPAETSAKSQPDEGLTLLSIPSINLNAVVVEGTSHKALLLGPGHMKDTPAPGEAGNSVISGHRDTFFRHVYELKKGDVVNVQRDGQLFSYEVTGKEIVEPTDLSVLDQSKDKRLTLITCYPTYYIGPAPKRLVVFAKLADTKDRASATAPHLASTAAAATR